MITQAAVPMKTVFSFTLVASVLLLAIGAPIVRAQVHDTRLSWDVWQPVNVPTTKSQAAGQNGHLTLVAWQGYVSGPDSIELRLQGQFLLDHQAYGSPFVIESRLFSPDTSFQVLPMGPGFLLAWNDVRDTSARSGYFLYLDTSGYQSVEQRIVPSGAFGRPGAFLVSDGAEYRLMWNPAMSIDSGSYWMGIDSSGHFTNRAGRISVPIRRVVQISDSSDVIYVDGGESGMFRVSMLDTSWQSIPPPLSGIIAIDPTGRMGRVEGTEFVLYPSMLDTTTFTRIPLPSSYVGVAPGSFAASCNSNGVLGVTCCDAWKTGSGSLLQVLIRSYFIPLLPDNSWKPGLPPTGSAVVFDAFQQINLDALAIKTTISRRCGDFVNVSVVLRIHAYGTHGGIPYDWTTFDTVEVVYSAERCYSEYYYPLPPIDCIGKLNSFLTASQIDRGPAGYIVLVSSMGYIGTDTVRVRKPLEQQPPQSRTPIIVSARDTLVVAWTDSVSITALTLARWDPSVQERVDSLVVLDFARDALSGVSTQTRLQQFGDHRYVEIRSGSAKRSMTQIVAPAPSGWETVFDFSMPDDSLNNVHSVMTDPDDSTVLMTFALTRTSGELGNIRIARFFNDSVALWPDTLVQLSMDAGTRPFPVDGPLFGISMPRQLLLRDSRAAQAYMTRFSSIGTSLPTPLLGDGVALVYGKDGRMIVEQLACLPDGKPGIEMKATPHTQPLPDLPLYSQTTSRVAWNVAVAQNPRDSGIAVVYGSAHGVRLTTIDQHGAATRVDERITESNDTCMYPSAVYVGDTLFVVWEDHRGARSRVYGTFVMAPTATVSGPDALERNGADHPRVTLTPNPARETTVLRWDHSGRWRAATYSIADLMGRVLQSGVVRNEELSLELSLRALSAGVYFVSVDFEGQREVRRLVIVD